MTTIEKIEKLIEELYFYGYTADVADAPRLIKEAAYHEEIDAQNYLNDIVKSLYSHSLTILSYQKAYNIVMPDKDKIFYTKIRETFSNYNIFKNKFNSYQEAISFIDKLRELRNLIIPTSQYFEKKVLFYKNVFYDN